MPDSSGTPDIETGADTLLSFLEEKTKWPASKIADDLGVPEKTVKKWAKALEKSGLVEIKYSAIRGMVLEYSSDKSYEELNQGRSELALQADELEIEAEEVETVEEEVDEEIAETKHNEEEEEDEIDEQEETSDKEDNHKESRRSRSIEHDGVEKRGFDDPDEDKEDGSEESKEKLESFSEEGDSKEKKEDIEKEDEDEERGQEGTDVNVEEKEDIEEGKEKLKNELKELEKKKGDSQKIKNEDAKTKAKLKADKAKIKKKAKKVSHKPDSGEVKDGMEEAVDRVHEKVSSMGDSEGIDHQTGESLEEHLENIRDLGDLLKDEEIENKDIYGKLAKEMEGLKESLVDIRADEEVKREVSETMEEVETDLENAKSPPGIFGKMKDFSLRIKERII